MKKSGLMDGAFIATAAIILTKIIGMLYVIPFYAIIGERGGSLYGYGYNIYNLFLIISSAGIPLAISKITSEYNALGKTKEKYYMYDFSKRFIYIFSIICFLICFLGAESIGRFIIGDMTGGNSIEDIATVIRSVSIALLIAPILSIYRGYLQGHKFIAASSFSQVIEQVVRIIIILVGSYLAIEIFDLSVTTAVSIAILGAAAGAVIGYLYLFKKAKKIDKNTEKIVLNKEEKKEITKKLFIYCIPFIAVNLSYYLYTSTDMILMIRTLDYLGYDAVDIEHISSIFTTWGSKLIAIVTSLGTGLVISLIPNMVAAYTKKETEKVNDQYGKAIEVLLIIVLPLAVFLSIYSSEIWTIFYGESHYGPIIFRYTSLVAFIDCLYLIMGCILQNLNKNKLIYITIALGLGLNALLDVPLMILFDNLGIHAFYGAITATVIGYTISVLYGAKKLKDEENMTYNFSKISKNILITLGTLIPLNILLSTLTTNVTNRLLLIVILGIFALLSLSIYYLINNKLLEKIFGKNLFKKILKREK